MKCCLLILVLIIGGCASSHKGHEGPVISAPEEEDSILFGVISDTFEGAMDIVKSPFRDLGLLEEDIPDRLETISSDPYVKPVSKKCGPIVEEIVELDYLLGSDEYLVAAASDGEEGYFSSGAKMAGTVAVGKLGGKVAIPFRGVIRRVSGASSHERKVSKAYQAGQLRRAYLIGMAESHSLNCSKMLEEQEKMWRKPAKKKNVVTVSL